MEIFKHLFIDKNNFESQRIFKLKIGCTYLADIPSNEFTLKYKKKRMQEKPIPKYSTLKLFQAVTLLRKYLLTRCYPKKLMNSKFCKTWAKANGFKYVWYSEGNILIKKANGDQTFIIRKQQDLQNIPVIQQSVNLPTQSTLHSSQASQSISKNLIIQPSILHLSSNNWNSQESNAPSPNFHNNVINKNPIAPPLASNSPNKPYLTKRFSSCHINPTSLCKNIDLSTAVQMKRAVTAFAISLFFCKLIKGFLKK